MRKFYGWILFAACLVSTSCLPHRSSKSSKPDSVDKSFIGEGTIDLAKALLHGFVDKDDNMVYSPLGYSAVLGIFAEGARGDSREEIATALHFPKDLDAVRLAYKSVLEKLHEKSQPNIPEFKNWFYVYKNYTVEEELKEALLKYYLTEVKSVDRPDEYVNKQKDEEMAESTKMEVKVLEKNDQIEDKPISISPASKVVNEKEEIMVPMQRRIGEKPNEAKGHFSGMTDSSLRIKGKGQEPQMIIFNGLYFKGDWKEPFSKKPADDSKVFYKSDKEKISVSTIRSEGEFYVGDIPNLDCNAIELPYKGERYSLLILVPKTRDGLTKLIYDLSVYPIRDIYKYMTRKLMNVCLPSFAIDCISKPISSLSKLGLSKINSIFEPERADLSGISEEPGLYVEEIVQMVSFKIDADYSSANFLTSSVASMRSNYENFQINQPFLFFLMDKIDNIIVINGKLLDPTPKPDFFSSP